MTVQDLMEMFTDGAMQEICLFDLDAEEVVYEGTYEDMPSRYEYKEVSSIDNLSSTTLTINIDLE